MEAEKTILDRLRSWFPTFFRLFPKHSQVETVLEAETVPLAVPADSVAVQPIVPFILGLDGLASLETLSTKSFLELMQWDLLSKLDGAKLRANESVYDFPKKDSFSTEAVLKAIQWDSEAVAIASLPESKPSSSSFISGLDDIETLNSMLNADLFQLLQWEVEGQTILPVASEDVQLLEDLLESFPEE